MNHNWTIGEKTRAMKGLNELMDAIDLMRKEERSSEEVPVSEFGPADVRAEADGFLHDIADSNNTPMVGLTPDQVQAAREQQRVIDEAALEVINEVLGGNQERAEAALHTLSEVSAFPKSPTHDMAETGKNSQRESNNGTEGEAIKSKEQGVPNHTAKVRLIEVEARVLTAENGNPYEQVAWEIIPGNSNMSGTKNKHQVQGKVLFGSQEVMIKAVLASDKREVELVVAPRMQYIPGHIGSIRNAINEWVGTLTEAEWAKYTGHSESK